MRRFWLHIIFSIAILGAISEVFADVKSCERIEYRSGGGKSINLEKIFKPNGKTIGKQVANSPQIRTVTKSHAENIINTLKNQGAKLVEKPSYPGKWYRLPNGKEFGVRTTNYHASLKHGTPNTIDVKKLGIGLEKIKY